MLFIKMALKLIILLACLATVVICESCPHPEDIYPCRCNHEGTHSEIIITCGSGSLDDIDNAFRHLQGLKVKEVSIKNLKLGRIPSVFFWGLNIQKIYFKNCEIERIADGRGKPAFLGLENSLEDLTIDYGFRNNHSLTNLNLIHLRRLKSLTLTSNKIPVISNDWFARGPGSLTDIRLQDNDIRELGDRAFASLGNLQVLEVSNNRFLKYFKRSMLPRPSNKLHDLNLRKNSLSSLPDDMFIAMPSLTDVHLESNKLQRMASKTWSEVWEQLQKVYFHENPLDCDSHIDWTTEKKRPTNLTGTCVSPEEKKGLQLKDLIDGASETTVAPGPKFIPRISQKTIALLTTK